MLLEFVSPVEFGSVPVVGSELAPPVVTSTASIEMAVIVMSDGGTDVSCAFAALPVGFVPAVVLDGVVTDGVVIDGLELDVEAVPVAPVPVAPVSAASVLAASVSPEVVEAPVVLPPSAWSTS